MLYEETEQGLIQVSLGYLADRRHLAIDIGRMEKDDQGRWIVPIVLPGGLPADLSTEQYEAELKEVAQQLQTENQLQVLFVSPDK